MYTYYFLNYNHGEDLPLVGRSQFTKTKLVEISTMYANQEEIDDEALSRKLCGKNLSTIYVLEYRGKNIILDGHHTVIAKKLKGSKKVKVKYLSIN
ncbi:hypothetical protein HZQ67_13935 [Elizabethkingia anophelis]|nr:hypothetical protein [Elizabethkingia anophelis]